MIVLRQVIGWRTYSYNPQTDVCEVLVNQGGFIQHWRRITSESKRKLIKLHAVKLLDKSE